MLINICWVLLANVAWPNLSVIKRKLKSKTEQARKIVLKMLFSKNFHFKV